MENEFQDSEVIDTRDPFKCTIQIQSGMNNLREIFSPILQWIDPVFQFVNLKTGCADLFQKTNKAITFGSTSHYHRRKHDKQDHQGSNHNSGKAIETQALSIVLFLHESTNPLSATQIQQKLQLPPWKYHHSQFLGGSHKRNLQQRNDNNSSTSMKLKAQQDYYAISKNLPLWAVSSVHCGDEMLRFHIFTRNHQAMKEFYSLLLDDKPTFSRSDFCFFTIYSQPGMCIQLSLKYDPTLLPQPCHAAFLQFRVNNMTELLANYTNNTTDQFHFYGRSGLWTTYDPDGNFLLLQDTDAANSLQPNGNLDLTPRNRYQSSICSSDSHDSGACSGENDDNFQEVKRQPAISDGVLV